MVFLNFKNINFNVIQDKINIYCPKLMELYNKDTNKIHISNDLEWVLNDYSILKNYLLDGNIPKLIQNSNNNFHTIIDLLNLYTFLKYYQEESKVNEIKLILDIYFKAKNYNDNQNSISIQIQKLTKSLYELQTLWMFPYYWKEKWSEYFETLMKKIIVISEPRNYISTNSYTSIFINMLINQLSINANLNNQITIKKKISDEMLFYMLEYCVQVYPSRNIFNINELVKLDYKLGAINSLNELKREFNYWSTPPNLTFNMEIIQKRMVSYSYGLINSNFPFNFNKYIIAGGFALNVIIGVVSGFSDIDIYIFEDFDDSVKTLINYFMSITDIKMTNNKSIINIYPIGYKINIQLIKIEQKPVSIINDFDMSYSQFCIFDWNNILMTFQAYQTLITGYFKINKNVIIKSYRIIKGYIKGFKLDKDEFLNLNNNINLNLKNNNLKKNKMIDSNINNISNNNINNNDSSNNTKIKNHKSFIDLSDEVKELILKLNCSDLNQLEQIIIDYLENNQADYNSLKKGIYLIKKDIETMSEEQLISYLENMSGCIYLNFDDFNGDNFVNLQYYNIDYDNIDDDINNINNINNINDNIDDNVNTNKYIITFPDMRDITFSKKYQTNTLKYEKINDNITLYELSVITGSYYQNLRALKFYPIKLLININDIKIFKLSLKDKIFKFKISYTKIDDNLKQIVNAFDFKIECLSRELLQQLCKFIDINNPNNNNKITYKKVNNQNKTITFTTNLDNFMHKYIDNSNFKFDDLKNFNNDCDKFTYLYELPKSLLKQDELLELKIYINCLWYQEKKNDNIFGYDLETIIYKKK